MYNGEKHSSEIYGMCEYCKHEYSPYGYCQDCIRVEPVIKSIGLFQYHAPYHHRKFEPSWEE